MFRGILTAVLVLTALVGPAALAQGEDLFNATALENGDVLIEHLNSYHNCCIFIGHEVEVQGFDILIKEIEPVLYGCWCTCWFDVEVVISDLPPGTYTIAYTYDTDANIYDEAWVTETFSVEKPLPNLMPVEPTFASVTSECTDGTSVPVPQVTFDRLKAYYR